METSFYEEKLKRLKKLLIILNVIMILAIIIAWFGIRTSLQENYSYIFSGYCKLEKEPAFKISGNLENATIAEETIKNYFKETKYIRVSKLYYERCLGFQAEIVFSNYSREKFMICKNSGTAYKYSKNCKKPDMINVYTDIYNNIMNSTSKQG